MTVPFEGSGAPLELPGGGVRGFDWKELQQGSTGWRWKLSCGEMAKGFLPYDIDQRLLLPPDMRAWLPEGHLALFIVDIVTELDLSNI